MTLNIRNKAFGGGKQIEAKSIGFSGITERALSGLKIFKRNKKLLFFQYY